MAVERVSIPARSCGHALAQRRYVRLTQYAQTSWYVRLAIADSPDAHARAVVELDGEQLAELGEVALELARQASEAKQRARRSRKVIASSV